MFVAVLFSVLCHQLALCTVGGSALRSHEQKRFDELTTDLKNYAHDQCSTMAQLTAFSNLVYTDRPGSHNPSDNILQNFDLVSNSSHVVLSRFGDQFPAPPVHLPVHVTGANKGLGLGLTKGVSRAAYYKVNKRVQAYFPLHHPRQNGSFCVDVAQLAEKGLSSFYEHMREDHKLSYVTILRNAALHRDGLVALECGWLQHRQSCGKRVLRPGREWRTELAQTIQSSSLRTEKNAWQSLDTLQNALGGTLLVYDEVFVIDGTWDYNYHHFMVESLPRLARFYHYLQRHTHIKIHIRAHEYALNMSDPTKVKRAHDGLRIRERLLQLLEIGPERVINGTLLARKLYLPNDIECTSSFKHAPELQLLSKLLMQNAEKAVERGLCKMPLNSASPPPMFTTDRQPSAKQADLNTILPTTCAKVVIQSRDCVNSTAPGARKKKSRDWRCFTAPQLHTLFRTAEVVFPQSQVVATRTSLTNSLACDIELYRHADVVIGLHGAAMTNAMFMRPGSVLVEIVGQFDPRMPPICGFHGPYAAVFGVHHYIYYYDGLIEGAVLDVQDVYAKAFDFYNAIRTNASYTQYNLSPR